MCGLFCQKFDSAPKVSWNNTNKKYGIERLYFFKEEAVSAYLSSGQIRDFMNMPFFSIFYFVKSPIKNNEFTKFMPGILFHSNN
jgi:hypothetical protein